MRWTVPMRIILLATALLFTGSAPGAPHEDAQMVTPCVMCRDQLKKDLEDCKAHDVGDARDVCRAGAQRKAKKCADDQGPAACNVDLLMDAPKDPGKAKPKG